MKKILSTSLLLIAFFTAFHSCKKDKPLETTGNISGIVSENGSNEPIEAAEVTLLGNSTVYKTGTDGKFEIKNLKEKDYTISISKVGYQTNKKQISVHAGQTTSADFSLEKKVPKLKVNVELLNFESTIENLPFSITNETEGIPLEWTIEKPESATWLSVSSQNGTTITGKTVITVKVDRKLMTSIGVHTAILVVKSTNGGGSKNITIVAEKTTASLVVTPTTLNFGTTETLKTFTIKNQTPGTTLNWEVEKPQEANWLSVSTINGVTNVQSTISVNVDRSLMTTSGVHTAILVVKSTNGIGSQQISIIAEKTTASLMVTPTTLNFETTETLKTFKIKNQTPGTTLDWEIEMPQQATWVSVSETNGTIVSNEKEITVIVDRNEITLSGSYSAILNIKSTNGGGSASVIILVEKQNANISVTPPVLNFGTTENSMRFTIKNLVNNTSLDWIIEKPESAIWLMLSEDNGTITNEEKQITVTVDRNNMNEAGDYTAVLNIKSTNGGGTATLTVLAQKATPLLVVNPELLDFGVSTEIMTFAITNNHPETPMNWQIEKSQNVNWIDISDMSGTNLTSGQKIITVTVIRNNMIENGIYNTSLIVKSTNGGGSQNVSIKAEKQGAMMVVEPSSLNFGEIETEKTLLVQNATQIGSIAYNAHANESWIILENEDGTITGAQTGSIKVKVNRVGLSAGNHNGTIVINSNANDVTINVSMMVVAEQTPSVSGLQASDITYNSADVSAYLSDVGSTAVSAYGFCWGNAPNPTTADNMNNLGGTSTPKPFSSVLTGLDPQTQYYVRAYATNDIGIAYSNQITINTLSLPTMPVVRTLNIEDIEYNQVTAYGSIDDLGDGYVTAHGFCYSTSNPNPDINNSLVSLGSTTNTGNFSGQLSNLEQQTHYFVRAYAINSLGTSYGATVEFTTPIAPPVVTSGLLAYYTFNEENCDDYLGIQNHCGILQGTGVLPTFVSDIPDNNGKALNCLNGKYYYIPTTPDINVGDKYSYAVWVKTTGTGFVYRSEYGGGYNIYSPEIGFNNGKVYYHSNNIFSGNGYFIFDVSSLLFDGEWHHVVITGNIVNKMLNKKLYIDGVFYSNSNYGDVYNHKNSATIGLEYIGKIDNLRIYNRTLTQDEIQEIYNARQ